MLMPLGRDYSLSAGSVEMGGYPCLPKVAQGQPEPAMRFRTKAYVPMHLDTGGRGGRAVVGVGQAAGRGGHCDPVWRWTGTHAPPHPRRMSGGAPLKFSPHFHGTGF